MSESSIRYRTVSIIQHRACIWEDVRHPQHRVDTVTGMTIRIGERVDEVDMTLDRGRDRGLGQEHAPDLMKEVFLRIYLDLKIDSKANGLIY